MIRAKIVGYSKMSTNSPNKLDVSSKSMSRSSLKKERIQKNLLRVIDYKLNFKAKNLKAKSDKNKGSKSPLKWKMKQIKKLGIDGIKDLRKF
jgi:hypothetical protein